MYLIQRLRKRQYPSDDLSDDLIGIDRVVSYDYMGSAEFEFGALGKAVKGMRDVVEELEIRTLREGGYDLYLVSVPDAVREAIGAFADQVGPCKMRLKEMTHLRACLEGHEWGKHLIGWWAIDGKPSPWCLFKDLDMATAFLAALKEKK